MYVRQHTQVQVSSAGLLRLKINLLNILRCEGCTITLLLTILGHFKWSLYYAQLIHKLC